MYFLMPEKKILLYVLQSLLMVNKFELSELEFNIATLITLDKKKVLMNIHNEQIPW